MLEMKKRKTRRMVRCTVCNKPLPSWNTHHTQQNCEAYVGSRSKTMNELLNDKELLDVRGDLMRAYYAGWGVGFQDGRRKYSRVKVR